MWNSTSQISTTEAMGTISGLIRIVRNKLFMGIFSMRRMANRRGMITASGTAIREKVAVLAAARRKAVF